MLFVYCFSAEYVSISVPKNTCTLSSKSCAATSEFLPLLVPVVELFNCTSLRIPNTYQPAHYLCTFYPICTSCWAFLSCFNPYATHLQNQPGPSTQVKANALFIREAISEARYAHIDQNIGALASIGIQRQTFSNLGARAKKQRQYRQIPKWQTSSQRLLCTKTTRYRATFVGGDTIFARSEITGGSRDCTKYSGNDQKSRMKTWEN